MRQMLEPLAHSTRENPARAEVQALLSIVRSHLEHLPELHQAEEKKQVVDRGLLRSVPIQIQAT